MPSITAATFNIGSSHKMFMHYSEENLRALARLIGDCGADVVGLQEVDRGARRSEGVDMTAFLSEHARYPHAYFIRIRAFQGGEYGTAILSRYPILESGTFHYPVKICTQETSAGYARIDFDGHPLSVFNTHISCESPEANAEGLRCYDQLLGAYVRGTGRRLIAMGDFNVDSEVVGRGIPDFARANPGLATYETHSIDNILLSEGVSASEVRVLDATSGGESDHNMLLCKICW